MIHLIQKLFGKKKLKSLNNIDSSQISENRDSFFVKLHTIFIMCGPSYCGKTHYVKDVLIPQLRKFEKDRKFNIQYLSSDNFRCQMLGNSDLDQRDQDNSYKMQFVSQAAFNMLKTQLEQVTQFPVNADFVIVDSTALDSKFRDEIIEIADKNQYHTNLILFNLSYKDFFTHVDSHAYYVSKHVKRFQEEVLPNVMPSKYDQVLRIKKRNRLNFISEIKGLDLFEKCHFNQEAMVVGDIHGCLDALLGLEQKSENKPIILIGDNVDNGSQSLEVLRHIKSNPEKYPLFVLGNHEWYDWNFLNGTKKESESHKWYTSITQYTGDALIEYKELLKWYVENAVPFVKMRDYAYITHAPCANKFIGKVDSLSIKRQSYVKITGKSDEILKKLEEDANYSYPKHIFGHMAFKYPYRFKNKVGIDTGGNSGNLFSYFVDGKTYNIPSNFTIDEEFRKPLIEITHDFDISVLSDREQSRIKWAIEEKQNFIAGTIAPCASDKETNELEPIHKAIEMFKNNGVTSVHIQRKYMGSRCIAYISKDISKCHLISRNGYPIRKLWKNEDTFIEDFTELYQSILNQPKIQKLFENYSYETIILDGELMPWYAMGKGLVEGVFQLIEKSVRSELNFLENTGFEELLECENREYFESKNVKITSNKEQTFKNLSEYEDIGIVQSRKYLDIYKRQIEIYGSTGEPDFYPFDLLKCIKNDGHEHLSDGYETNVRYDCVSRDEGWLINLNNSDADKQIMDIFNNLLENEEDVEGVVIKDNCASMPKLYGKSKVNCLKVRNPSYLTLIYGWNYLWYKKYDNLVQKKRIDRKLKISNKEYYLGQDMLQIKNSDINEDNLKYKQILAQLILEERSEKELDPRL